MGRRCAVSKCETNKSKGSATIHLFPTQNPFLRQRWLEFAKLASSTKITETNCGHFGLCSRHFHADCYVSLQHNTAKKLTSTAVPTILGSTEVHGLTEQSSCIPP